MFFVKVFIQNQKDRNLIKMSYKWLEDFALQLNEIFLDYYNGNLKLYILEPSRTLPNVPERLEFSERS